MSYVSQIVDHFLECHSEKGILDPADYTMIAEWEKQDIPLGIVVAAISDVASKTESANSNVGSVVSLQERIQQSYFDSLQTRTAAAGAGERA